MGPHAKVLRAIKRAQYYFERNDSAMCALCVEEALRLIEIRDGVELDEEYKNIHRQRAIDMDPNYPPFKVVFKITDKQMERSRERNYREAKKRSPR